MNLPFTLPNWLPWWVPLALLVPLLLYLAVFLLMPFSVIGLKGRLDLIEARLDEIQGEIRNLVLRFPAPESEDERGAGARRDALDRPPIPPAPARGRAPAYDSDAVEQAPWPPAVRAPLRPPPIPEDPRRRPTTREEPRLDWRG